MVVRLELQLFRSLGDATEQANLELSDKVPGPVYALANGRLKRHIPALCDYDGNENV